MGEQKRQITYTQEFLLKHPTCIFCGDVATTIEHCPPKIVFRNKQWPETFEFPACKQCNEGSKTEDQLFGFFVRMADQKDLNAVEQEAMNKLLRAISRHHPDLARGMLQMSRADKRRLARETGIRPQSGQLYDDLPFVHIPDELIRAVQIIAAKIIKALHFKVTGELLPKDAGIRFAWFTNAQALQMKTPIVPDLIKMFTHTTDVIRNNSSIKDQFDFMYSVSADHKLSAFFCYFGTSFCFISFASAEWRIMEEIITRVKEKSGESAKKMTAIQWPLPYCNS